MVLIVSYSGHFGGAERVLLEVARTISGRVVVACPDGPLADAVRGSAIPVVRLPSRALEARGSFGVGVRAAAALLEHGVRIRRLAHDLGAEVVVAWGMRSALSALLGPDLGSPVVFQHNDFLPGRLVGSAARAAARRAALVIGPSRAVVSELGTTGTVIHPGVRLPAPSPFPDSPRVALLGAVQPWKRPELALEAVALVRRSLPEVRLRIVGAPLTQSGEALLRRLRERAAAPDLAGAVEFAGAVPNGASALADVSCLLHCAPREPYGIAVVEALAAGRPAVVPDAGGPTEIVDASCGVRYAPGDAEAAAEALVAVLGDPARAAALGAAGRERAAREFSLERMREAYTRALDGVVRVRPVEPAAGAGLALVTVTRNSASDLRRLLASVARHLPAARVIVVDCDSDDASVGVAASFDRVSVVALGENVGFGRANNRGMAEVDEDVVVLVNPDVELVDGSLATLATAARVGAERLLAPAVLLPDGSRQDSVHPVPASPADLLRAILPFTLLPRRIALRLAPWRSRREQRVGWAVGCALVARTETLRRLGPFDERIFMFAEDLDLGLRAAADGVETWFCPAARVIHHASHTTLREFGGEPFAALARARHEVVARNRGPAQARLDDAAQAFTFRSRVAAKRTLGRAAERERRQLEAVAGAREDD